MYYVNCTRLNGKLIDWNKETFKVFCPEMGRSNVVFIGLCIVNLHWCRKFIPNVVQKSIIKLPF